MRLPLFLKELRQKKKESLQKQNDQRFLRAVHEERGGKKERFQSSKEIAGVACSEGINH